MTRALFEPLTLRDVEIRNRIWIPPMCQYSVDKQDGVPTTWHLMHLGSFARGGAGLVTVEATGVLPEGRISPQCLGLWNDEQRDAFVPIVDLFHSQGAKASIQLAHAGRKASTWRAWPGYQDGNVSLELGGWTPVGPSPVAFPGLVEPSELTTEQIDAVVVAFVEAARRAVDAGFDVVELHGAHGYLLHQFLSPASNHRADEYGGPLDNRARLLLRVVDAVRSELGESVPLVVRLSGSEWSDEGYSEDDVVAVLAAGADDYVVKPLARRVLLARLQAVLRRKGGASEASSVQEFGRLTVDFDRRQFRIEGKSVTLTERETDLALHFFRSPGRLLTRDHLIQVVWSTTPLIDTRTVDVHVSTLRRKLGLTPEFGWRLASIYGHGYRLERQKES